jgi:hypothetical protein
MSEHLGHCDKDADFQNCLCIEERVTQLEKQLEIAREAIRRARETLTSTGYCNSDGSALPMTISEIEQSIRRDESCDAERRNEATRILDSALAKMEAVR